MGGVMKINGVHLESLEQSAHLRQVIQAQHKFALESRESFRHFQEVLALEVVPVELARVVRRIEIEQGRWAVVVVKNLFVRKALNLNARQAAVGLLDQFRYPIRVEPWGLNDVE